MLTLENISFSYPPAVLRGVSVGFPAGHVTAIVGPNGCGKSTLLRVALGVLHPQEGRVRLGALDLTSISARDRARRVAFVPQASSVAFSYSVREVVRLGIYAADRGKNTASEVDAALRVMELWERQDEPIGLLSAGQQQRATMARALAQLGNPRTSDESPEPWRTGQVLLADEPVSAMDPAFGLRAMEVLRRVAREGAAVVAVLHDLSLVLGFADRVVVLGREGRVASAGEVREAMTPAVLESVFGVRFESMTTANGKAAGFAVAAHSEESAGGARRGG